MVASSNARDIENLVRPILKMKKKKRSTKTIKHFLIPEHRKLSQKESQEVLDKYKVTLKELPCILINDPAIQSINPKVNDVIEIKRRSATAGETIFYRVVIDV